MNLLPSSPQGSYTYGDSAHLDAATAIGPSGGTATWTASYDAAGNTACRAATSATTCAGTTPNGALLSWDNEGRLTAWQNIANVTTSPTSIPALEEALYDGAGQRVQHVDASDATTTTTQHTYVGGSEDLASQWPNAGGATTTTTTAYYGGGPAGGLAESVNGTLSYLLGDQLHSVSESVTTSGTVTATQLYGPYGAVRYQSGTLPTDYGFTHQRADATSGLDYYGARSYDPVVGQFTSADTLLPKSVAMPDPHQLNRYAYVGGNPETRTDPTGHRYTCPVGGCGGNGNAGGNSGGGGPHAINQGSALYAALSGSPCNTVATCAGVQYPEGGAPAPCNETRCWSGNDPNGIFKFLPQQDGQNATMFVLTGRDAVAWFYRLISGLKANIDGYMNDVISRDNAIAAWVSIIAGVIGGVAGGLAGIPGGPGGIGAGIAIGASVAGGAAGGLALLQTQHDQNVLDGLDAMLQSLLFHLSDVEAAMNALPDKGAHTAIVVAETPITSYNKDYDQRNNGFEAWQNQDIQVTDVYSWK